MDFVAIDFETANRFWSSACEIGMVVVEDGRVVDTYRRLIRPTPNQFDSGNIRIHKITPQMVMHEPTFAELYEDMLPYLADKHIVAHNASFDIGVLRASTRLYTLPEPSLTYSCTVQLARKCWPDAPRYGLGIISSYLGIELSHHQALSDANACAQIMIQAGRMFGSESVEELLGELNLKPRSITQYGTSTKKGAARWQPRKTPQQAQPSYASAATAPPARERTYGQNWPSHPRIKDIAFDTAKADARHPAYGKRFVFTGELTDTTREDAMRLVLEAGGKCTGTVSKATDYLVQGTPTWKKQTSKTQKAFELRDQGTGIELLDETGFMELFERGDEG